jgi:ferritin-like metal-binding protein YciE
MRPTKLSLRPRIELQIPFFGGGNETTHMPTTSSELDRYILHLNHALAMEAALVDHLEKRAQAVSNPEVRQRILQHRDETLQHRDTVQEIIKSVNGEPTTTKAVVQPPITPGILGKVMTALESEKEDRLLSEDLADFAVEHYEAGLYSALMLIARNVGYPQHASRFEIIRQQEQDMADFIESGQPTAIREAFPPAAQAA